MIFVSYHNMDLGYAFRLAGLLIRYYRRVWLDRFEISPMEDWDEKARQAYEGATGALVIVSEAYLESGYCRREYERFKSRGLPITAVIARDFSTEKIADFAFDDWIDFRRWFEDPQDLSIENLLNRIPQSENTPPTGERADYLREFIERAELALAKRPSAWISLRDERAEIGPRGYAVSPLQDWEFDGGDRDSAIGVDNLLLWAEEQSRFILEDGKGSGGRLFARLLGLAYAHNALRDNRGPTPIWLDLGKWGQEHASLEAFIESEWRLISYWKHWLGSNQALLILDHWSELAACYPERAGEIREWIAAGENHRFVLLSSQCGGRDPDMPTLSLGRMSARMALKYAGECLSLQQLNSFRRLARQQQFIIESDGLDYLLMGIELLAADRALAVNQWHKNPLPALIACRSRQMRSINGEMDSRELTGFLRGLAWRMTQEEVYWQIGRGDVEKTATDGACLDFAIAIGILEEAGTYLRFTSTLHQWYLASDSLSKAGIQSYVNGPQFSGAGQRATGKWDRPMLIFVDKLADEERAGVIEEIAEINPFLANACLERHPELYDSLQDSVIQGLAREAADKSAARGAFRACVHSMPEARKTAESLIGQMGRYDRQAQLWLWGEVLELPLDLPLGFVETVANIDRHADTPVIDALADYPLWLAVCYLVKLLRSPDKSVHANAVWMLGEIKYLPTAALLLEQLEKGQGANQDALVLALMKYAYSDILARLLSWAREHPEHLDAVASALEARGRRVSGRLLSLAGEGSLELNAAFFELMVSCDEVDMAIGLAQLVPPELDVPERIRLAIAGRKEAGALRSQMDRAIHRGPNREQFGQLLEDIAGVLDDPPESTIIAGSRMSALLYGEQIVEGVDAQGELPPALAPPDDGIPDEIEGQLRDENWQTRHGALNRLAEYPAALALPHLLDVTGDREPLVRLAVYDILWRFSEDATARKAIIAGLADPDAQVVSAVTGLLKNIGDLEYDDLVDLLDSDNAGTAAAAIDILGAAGHQPALDALFRLRDDGRPAPAYEMSIGELASRAIDALNRERAGPGEQSTIPSATLGPGPGERRGTAKTGYSDEEKVQRALALLRDDDWGRAQKAAKFLRRFAKHLRDKENSHICRMLCDALGDSHWQLRWAVAEALAWLGNPAAKEHLPPLLDDSHWIVQIAAIRALLALGARESVERMKPLLRNPHKSVRESAAEALGELRNPTVARALGECYERDGDDFVRLAALKSMQQLDANLAREYLEQALGDGFIHLRWYAAQTLTARMDADDIPVLRRLLRDDGRPDWEEQSIRDFAIEALRRINTAESMAAIESAGQNRAGA